jgi:hypothetical protein
MTLARLFWTQILIVWSITHSIGATSPWPSSLAELLRFWDRSRFRLLYKLWCSCWPEPRNISSLCFDPDWATLPCLRRGGGGIKPTAFPQMLAVIADPSRTLRGIPPPCPQVKRGLIEAEIIPPRRLAEIIPPRRLAESWEHTSVLPPDLAKMTFQQLYRDKSLV